MILNFKDEIMEITDARIIYRNFAGEASKFNRAGDRNFAVVVPDEETKDQMVERGWVVKIKPPREEGDDPFMYLSVAVNFNGRGPGIYLNSNGNVTRLNEETAHIIDELDIESVDMDLRPYHWEVSGETGVKAYLHAINITQRVDRFGAKYAQENPDFNNF